MSQQQKHFFRRSTSIKLLWLEMIENIGCSKSVQPSTVIYIIHVYNTDWLWAPFWVTVVSSRWTFHKIHFFVDIRKKCYIFKTGEQSLQVVLIFVHMLIHTRKLYPHFYFISVYTTQLLGFCSVLDLPWIETYYRDNIRKENTAIIYQL